MDVPDYPDEVLDPRIQIELENLNDATDVINKLESELDEAHAAFRQLLSETTKRLKEILNKIGSNCVEKARCYYEALEVARQAQIKCQQQAQLFQRASEIHAAAKETVALAESRFTSHQHEWNFDQAWQDMLNHATLKVMDAENQKAECGREHYRKAVLLHDAKKKLLELEEKHRRAIIKARPYFEVKVQCDQMLATQKERVEYLQTAIKDAKNNYATSLHRLEEISNQIHQQRKDYDFIANGPREPGVGAELISPQKTLDYEKELNQLNVDRVKHIANHQVNDHNTVQEYNDIYILQEDTEHLGKRSVDGSEATSQWELELETNMENLSTNKAHSAYNLNQFKKSIKNVQSFKNTCVSKPLMTHFEESNPTDSKIHDPTISNKCKVDIENDTSKLLSITPSITDNLSSHLISPQKGENQNTTKYMPNIVFENDFNAKKSQSNSNIDLPLDCDTNSAGKHQSWDDIASNKTDNLESDKESTYLNFGMTKETYKTGLNTIKHLHSTQLSDCSMANSKLENVLTKKWFKSSSSYLLYSKDSTSPVKLKCLVKASSENLLNKQFSSSSSSDKTSAIKNLTRDTSFNFRELPLLSMFEKTNMLNSKYKSCSMINLSDRQNFIPLNDLYQNNFNVKSIDEKRQL